MNDYKETDFYTYCKTCKHQSKNETECPCSECLDNPFNIDSLKPVKWEEK